MVMLNIGKQELRDIAMMKQIKNTKDKQSIAIAIGADILEIDIKRVSKTTGQEAIFSSHDEADKFIKITATSKAVNPTTWRFIKPEVNPDPQTAAEVIQRRLSNPHFKKISDEEKTMMNEAAQHWYDLFFAVIKPILRQ